MKKFLITVITFLLVFSIGFTSPNSDGFKKLKKIRKIQNIKIYRDKVHKVKARYEKGYIVELSLIRDALEKAGVDETVTIEVRYKAKLKEILGTYTPVVSEKDGEKKIEFSTMPVGKRVFTNLSRVHLERVNLDYGESDAPQLLRHLKIYFKNIKNKTKAKLNVSFLYIN